MINGCVLFMKVFKVCIKWVVEIIFVLSNELIVESSVKCLWIVSLLVVLLSRVLNCVLFNI